MCMDNHSKRVSIEARFIDMKAIVLFVVLLFLASQIHGFVSKSFIVKTDDSNPEVIH